MPWIKAEAVVEAAAAASNAREALAGCVRALVAFHTSDLDRFRQMYLSIQVDPKPHKLLSGQTLQDDVHPATARMYGALEQALCRDPAFRKDLDARQVAFTVHSATLGVISMVALGQAVGDPIRHHAEDLSATLITLLDSGMLPPINDQEIHAGEGRRHGG